MQALNPRLVYCSITGFGQTGPYAPRAGYDFLIQGMGGLMSITGRADGEPGAGPQKVGVALTDILTGLYATIAILAALRRNARRTGRRPAHRPGAARRAGRVPGQPGDRTTSPAASRPSAWATRIPNIVPYQDFPTADGDMILAVGNDGQFAKFCEAAGPPEWASDPRFATQRRSAWRNRAALCRCCASDGDCRRRSSGSTLLRVGRRALRPDQPARRRLRRPAGSLRAACGSRCRTLTRRRVPLVANPIRLSDSPVAYRLAPPLLGQHTAEVLADWLKLDAAAVDALHTSEVIQVPKADRN